jgi:hypothetical protein
MGFNPMQPGKIKRSDLLYLAAAVVILVALVIWATS